jgi:DNA end-binding protein Ku
MKSISTSSMGQKPYALLRDAMVELKRQAIGTVVMSGKEQIVLLRPMDNLLSMTQLSYEHQVTKPSNFDSELTKPAVEPEELKLAKTLIEASTPKKLDYSKYRDVYTEKLTKLIEAKVAGQEIVAPPIHEEAQVINLMDALRKSVAQAQGAVPQKAGGKPPKKMATSVRKEERVARKRKSG